MRQITLFDSHTYAGRYGGIGEIDVLKGDGYAFALQKCFELVSAVIGVYGYGDESVGKHRRVVFDFGRDSRFHIY